MGHTYSPIFQVTPLAGDASTVDISAMTYLTLCQPRYEWIAGDKELLDRDVEQSAYGYRCSVEMVFEFPTSSADETTLSEDILDKAADGVSTIELSLDAGTTYREVMLSEFSQNPMSGKNIGVVHEMVWTCKALLKTKAAVGSGGW